MLPAGAGAPFDWEREGRRIGSSLDRFHSVVVLGDDVEATARVALGIARAQTGHRRVGVGDLLGEAPPIQALVDGEDAHGLVDCFLYGISFIKIARRVRGPEELWVLPSGSQPLEYEEIVPSARWRRLVGTYEADGGLLVVAAPASAPEIERLVAATDGAVLVGDNVPARLPVAQVIASIRRPPTIPHPTPSSVIVPGGAAGAREIVREVGRDEPRTAPRRATAAPTQARRPAWLTPPAVAGLVVALLLAVLGVWLATRPLDHSRTSIVQRPRDTTGPAPTTPPIDSATALAIDPTTVVDPATVPDVTNPGDSARAATWTVVGPTMNNTPAGAMFMLTQGAWKGLPAATYVPVLVKQATWFQPRMGAYADSADADGLRRTLVGNEMVSAEQGRVIRAPLAFLVDSASTKAAADGVVAEYLGRRQVPAYALRRPTGAGWRIYVGAFTTPVEASLYVEPLRAAGITPVLAYRLGR